jgi:glycosyltransferase involved in cell wall biosynthesis
MRILFCSRHNLCRIKKKKGGDLSNIAIFSTLSEIFDVDLAVSEFSASESHVRGLSRIIGLQSLNRSWPLFYVKHLNSTLSKCDFRYDFIFATKGSLLAAYDLSVRFNIPLVLVVRDFHELPIFGKRNGKPFAYSIIKHIAFGRTWKKIYEHSYCVLTSSNYLGTIISKFYSVKRLETIYPHVEGSTAAVDKCIVDTSKPIGMISGSKYKGEEIIFALARRMPNRQFVIYNSVTEVSRLENLSVKGYTDADEIFSQISILLVPSTVNETFGRVVIEAIMRGIPCLCHDIGGLSEAMRSPLFRVPYKNLDQWINKIEKIFMGDHYFIMQHRENIRSVSRFRDEIHRESLRRIITQANV